MRPGSGRAPATRRRGGRRPDREDAGHATGAVALRPAAPGDEPRLRRLAERDSAAPPSGPCLLAEVGGELRVAYALADGRTIADPFHPTADLVELLRLRAAQLEPPPAGGGRLRAGRRLALPRPRHAA